MSSSTVTDSAPCFLRHRALGTEAVYEVLGERDGIVTAEVVCAPGVEDTGLLDAVSQADLAAFGAQSTDLATRYQAS